MEAIQKMNLILSTKDTAIKKIKLANINYVYIWGSNN